jgi:hypothetical protein
MGNFEKFPYNLKTKSISTTTTVVLLLWHCNLMDLTSWLIVFTSMYFEKANLKLGTSIQLRSAIDWRKHTWPLESNQWLTVLNACCFKGTNTKNSTRTPNTLHVFENLRGDFNKISFFSWISSIVSFSALRLVTPTFEHCLAQHKVQALCLPGFLYPGPCMLWLLCPASRQPNARACIAMQWDQRAAGCVLHVLSFLAIQPCWTFHWSEPN